MTQSTIFFIFFLSNWMDWIYTWMDRMNDVMDLIAITTGYIFMEDLSIQHDYNYLVS